MVRGDKYELPLGNLRERREVVYLITRVRGTIQKTRRQDVRLVHVRMAFVVLQPTSWMPSAQTHTEHSTVTRESESLPYDNRMHLVRVKLTDGQIVGGVSRKLQATRTRTQT